MSGSIIRDSFWLGIPIYFSFENLFLQICTSAWYIKQLFRRSIFRAAWQELYEPSEVNGAFRAKRETRITWHSVSASRASREISPLLAWLIKRLSRQVNCVCETQNRYKKRLHCEYCNQGHLDKVHHSDYRKITIDFEKVGCGPISGS